jgi:hypothetical protein
MRLLVALSGSFLPPASVFAPWGFLRDGRLLVEFPGVADLIGLERSESPYIAPRGPSRRREVVPGPNGAHPEDIPALCDLFAVRSPSGDGLSTELDERRRGYEGDRTEPGS